MESVSFSEIERSFESGNLTAARNNLTALVEAEPSNGPAWHLLGLVEHQSGNIDHGIQLIRLAIGFGPDRGHFATNLTEILRKKGDLLSAIEAGKYAVLHHPESAAAWSNLGIAYFDNHDFDAAKKAQRHALRINPHLAKAENNLGSIYQIEEDSAKAETCFRRAADLDPTSADPVINLATLLVANNKATNAKEILKAHIEQHGQTAALMRSLGKTETALYKHDQAEICFKTALALNPKYCEAYIDLSNTFYDKNRPELAAKTAEQAVKIDPNNAMAHLQIGRCLDKLDYSNRAKTAYDKSLKLRPDNTTTLLAIGHWHLEHGDRENARVHFEKARALSTNSVAALCALASLETIAAESDILQQLEAALANIHKNNPKQQALLHFGLGNAYHDTGRYDDAFQQFALGGKKVRQTLNYDSAVHRQLVDLIIETFTADRIQALRAEAIETCDPIFILGMPRSGTTLTESIIASHPDIIAGGELAYLNTTFFVPNSQRAVAALRKIFASSDQEFRQMMFGYQKHLTRRGKAGLRITDKMPSNFMHIGLIHALLPKATIIHMKRDKLDTCLSNFTCFFQNSQYHSYDLTELGNYYNDYARLMQHWAATLPATAFKTVEYQNLTQNPEQIIRDLIDYCGLSWDDRCMEFNKNKRVVKTASLTQVLQPIYTSSLNKWQHYEHHLDELKAVLTDPSDN